MPTRNPIRQRPKLPLISAPIVASQIKSERRIILLKHRLRRLQALPLRDLLASA